MVTNSVTKTTIWFPFLLLSNLRKLIHTSEVWNLISRRISFPRNLACVASVSVGLGSKERDFWCFALAENEERAKKWNLGVGEWKEGNACRQTPGFWKPAPFASERGSWLAGLVEKYWQVSIKGLNPLGARKKWKLYVYKERSLFSPNEDFVVSFDDTVAIL